MKPASRTSPGFQIDFWLREGGITAASNEEEANVASMTTGIMYPSVDFDWPQQQYLVEQLERMLNRAVETGKYLAKEEFRNWLGVSKR